MFFDLQCPFSRKLWAKVPELRDRFGNDYDISLHTTSLAFHRQSFPAQTAAYLIGMERGQEARERFQSALYANMERYVDAEADSMTKSQLYEVFADIAQQEGLLVDDFLEKLADREKVIMPTWREHKEALKLGVFKAPQHVINGKLLPDTESSWEIEDYERALSGLTHATYS